MGNYFLIEHIIFFMRFHGQSVSCMAYVGDNWSLMGVRT